MCYSKRLCNSKSYYGNDTIAVVEDKVAKPRLAQRQKARRRIEDILLARQLGCKVSEI